MRGVSVFTDGSSLGRGGYVMAFSSRIQDASFSCAQKTELQAVIWALQGHSSTAINCFSDGTFVCNVVCLIQTATIHIGQEDVFTLYHSLICHLIMPCSLFYWSFTFSFSIAGASH